MENDEIWGVGRDVVAQPRNKPLYARADLLASTALDLTLTVEPDTAPHRKHANIEGWPAEDDQKLQLAMQLASAAVLIQA